MLVLLISWALKCQCGVALALSGPLVPDRPLTPCLTLQVYCTSDTSVTALPQLTEATGATFKAAFVTKIDSEEAVERGLTDLGERGGAGGEDGWLLRNDWGSWVQELDFYYIPADGERAHACYRI